ncbi:protein TPX2-like [Mangifera indica]|uniref:protein TPX2-like n=1 Tax=Mangifera indica TaxID=29780 RepID=UPI001CFB1D23|nr:protein TPX2-like [Mangifera indica]
MADCLTECFSIMKVYVREQEAVPPFISMAEMMKKFDSSTRDLSLPHILGSEFACLPTLSAHVVCSCTYHIFQIFHHCLFPKNPFHYPEEAYTDVDKAQGTWKLLRVRSVKVKSTAELEEEMMAKIPKFRARPLNKKALFSACLISSISVNIVCLFT